MSLCYFDSICDHDHPRAVPSFPAPFRHSPRRPIIPAPLCCFGLFVATTIPAPPHPPHAALLFRSICGHDHPRAVPSSPRRSILPAPPHPPHAVPSSSRRSILLTPPHPPHAAPSVHGYKTTQSAR